MDDPMKFDGYSWRRNRAYGYRTATDDRYVEFYRHRDGKVIDVTYSLTNMGFAPDGKGGRGFLLHDGEVYTCRAWYG